MDELVALGEFYRSRGITIVSTNGCFDLIHAGHVQMLSQARKLGGVLVVGVNDDDSVRRLKGPNRPLIGQLQRVQLLAAMKAVGHVVIFGGMLPTEMLGLLKPDVHCKAADYTAETMPEAETVLAHGGRIEILPLRDGLATSELLVRAATAVASGNQAADPEPTEAEGMSEWVLAQMLGTANLHRQSAYKLAKTIAQAARQIDRALQAGCKTWIFADGRLDEGADFLARSLSAAYDSSIGSPSGAVVSQALPEETDHPCGLASAGDLLFLICGSELSQAAKKLIRDADEKQMSLIVLDAGADLPPSDSAKTRLSIGHDDPTLIRMLRYAVIRAICQAVDHVSEESVE